MRPRPLNRKTDLVAIAREYAPTKACARAIDEGRAIVLGGFNYPGGFPRWIVRVTSRHDKTWYIAILADEECTRFRIEYPTLIFWRHWAGVIGRNHPVYDGDTPTENAFKRMRNRNGNAR